jgi:hypothetical protein
MKKPDTSWFNDTLATWLVEQCGPKPTLVQLQVPLHFGKKPGVEALHIAMCLRKGGCTVRQYQIAGSCGPANNYRLRLVREGLVSITVEGKPYAYKLVLTPAGEAVIEKAKAKPEPVTAAPATAKPVKAKAVKKARKVKAPSVVAAPDTAAIDAPVNEPVLAEPVLDNELEPVT